MKFTPGQHVRAVLADTTVHVITGETYPGMADQFVITRPETGGHPDLWHERDLRAA